MKKRAQNWVLGQKIKVSSVPVVKAIPRDSTLLLVHNNKEWAEVMAANIRNYEPLRNLNVIVNVGLEQALTSLYDGQHIDFVAATYQADSGIYLSGQRMLIDVFNYNPKIGRALIAETTLEYAAALGMAKTRYSVFQWPKQKREMKEHIASCLALQNRPVILPSQLPETSSAQ